MAWLCYAENADISKGKNLLFGMMHLFPELDRGYPQARRALDEWKKVAIQGEGAPVPWDGVFGIAATMQRLGFVEEADICEIAADTYMRESDWSLLQVEDVIESKSCGVSSRTSRLCGP